MATFQQNVSITVTESPPSDPPDEDDLVYDAGWEVTPVRGKHAGGPKIVGRNKGAAALVYPLDILGASGGFTVKLTPDWSDMSKGGTGIILGFGFVDTAGQFHIIGQVSDGGMQVRSAVGSGLTSTTFVSVTLNDFGAATNGSEDGPNYQQIEGSGDGETYTFRTSAAGVTYDDEAAAVDPDPFLDLSEPRRFGIGVYVPGNNKGTLSVNIVIIATYISGPFASDGASLPNYSGVMMPAFYDSGSGRTYYAWEAFIGSQRSQNMSWIDHATGKTGDIYGMGMSPLTDDAHGNPSIVLDAEGHLWGWYGSHITESFVSSTRWPIAGAATDDGSLWEIKDPLGTGYTYPHGVLIGSTLYVFFRKDISASSKMPIVLRSGTPSGGDITWGSESTVIDMGTDARLYQGNCLVSGTEIHFLLAKADYNDTVREHVYYFIYDTADGSMSNWDKSATIASGDLPVDLTEANADFRIFEHTGGNAGWVPSLAFDTNGDPHAAFTDGTGASYSLKAMTVSGGSWTTPDTLDTLDYREAGFGIGQLPAGEVEVVYAKDDDSLFSRGGNIRRRVRSSGGSWAASEIILTAGADPLDQPNPVVAAHTDARWVFVESKDGDSNDSVAGGLDVYMWGSSGLIGRHEQIASITDSSGDLLLGADELLLGTDQLTIDTTDD